MTAADVLTETLIDWGVDVVFGLPVPGEPKRGQIALAALSEKVREMI